MKESIYITLFSINYQDRQQTLATEFDIALLRLCTNYAKYSQRYLTSEEKREDD